MTEPATTDLTCIAVVDETFGAVFESIGDWRRRLEIFVGAADVNAAGIDDTVEELVVPELTRDGALIIGAGFVAQPGFIPDAPWHLAWWLGHANTFGVTGPAQPALRRLVAVEDDQSESFRDYTTLEWWRVPASSDLPHVTGPYVDYLCTDDYTLTLTVPAHDERTGAFIGVVGADIYVNDIERALLPAVRAAGRVASLVNASGRVVVSTHHATGALLRIDDLAKRAAERDEFRSWDGRRIISCATPSLILVIDED